MSPELACAYSGYYAGANATGIELYTASWTAYIQSLRNHPSIMIWTMCNENYIGDANASHFYRIAKQLDPSRLVMDSDGSCSAEGGSPQRKTLEVCSQQCDAWNLGSWGSIVLENPHRYHDTCNSTTHACRFAHPPMIPSISHETGNYNTYPRLNWLIDKFNSPASPTIKPYWLTGAWAKLNASGLLAEVDDWATASEELYLLMWVAPPAALPDSRALSRADPVALGAGGRLTLRTSAATT